MADCLRLVDTTVLGIGDEQRDITTISPDYTLLMIGVTGDARLKETLARVFITSGFNRAHDLVSHILLANPSNTVITSNFDTALENCLSDHHSGAGIQLSVGSLSCALEDLFAKRRLVKVHGCATRPSSIIVTLKEEHRTLGEWINLEEFGFGFMQPWPQLMDKLMERPILFLGYSGRDNFYRYIRNSKTPRRLFWLLRDSGTGFAGEPPATFFEGDAPQSVDVTLATGDLCDLPPLLNCALRERAPEASVRFAGFLPQQWDDSAVLALLSLVTYLLPQTAAVLLQRLRYRLAESSVNHQAFVQVGIRIANAVGDRKACLSFMEEALARARQTGEEQMSCLLSTHVGICHLDLGDYSSAFEHMQFVHERASTLPFEVRALNLFHLGELYSSASRWDLAEQCYEKSLELCRLTGDLYFEAQAYNSLGNLHRQQLHVTEAMRYYRRSLEIKECLGEEKLLANTLNNLATMCMQEGAHEEAMSFLKRELGELGDAL
jgi:tetratricopeptide (TPR) repeat protein